MLVTRMVDNICYPGAFTLFVKQQNYIHRIFTLLSVKIHTSEFPDDIN